MVLNAARMANLLRRVGLIGISLTALIPIPGETRTLGKAKNSTHFVHHVLDSDLSSLGADIGDLGQGGPADIIALDAKGIYLYSGRARSTIDEFATPTLFIHLRTADIDRDGDVDVIAVDHMNGNLFYYENPGPGPAKRQFWPRHVVDDQVQGAHAVAVADLNRDGRIDVVASGEDRATPPNSLFWFECPAEPNRADRWVKHVLGPSQSGGLAHYPAIGDANADGRLDVVHAAKGGEWYRLWLQPPDPTAPWTLKEIGSGYTLATNIQPGDVNGDGKVDFVATQGHHQGILWFEAPDFKPHFIDQSLKSPHTLVLADIDDDGDLDVASCAFESRILAWFENNGQGSFQRHDVSENQEAYDLVARDVDGDGDLDLIVAGRESRTVSWYEQVRPARPNRP
ncbi:MAG: VCBS repeat-containing protein [Acidobacteriota bacterium]